MENERIKPLNDREAARDGSYVLYWMQESQRADFNPALEHAIERADALNKPVVVGFGLTTGYPDANLRHYAFMLQGLEEVEARLKARGIRFVMRAGSPDEVTLALAEDAALVVCDRSYLKPQRRWRERVASEAGCAVVQVEGNVVVPIECASDKAEYAARTIRPKIERQRDRFMNDLTSQDPGKSSLRLAVKGDLDPSDAGRLLKTLEVDREVPPVARFTGGCSTAREKLETFLRTRFEGYGEGRSEPAAAHVSELSPYLHFGQISPVEIALKAASAKSGGRGDKASFLEELIVRRELAVNFVYYTENYDSYESLPNWARQSLEAHRDDARSERYTLAEMEAGRTADRYWNAAMMEMRETGYMHNTMRMYWGKQIIKWCNTPDYAYRVALTLNNKYFIDGRDANSFTNIAWLFGLHDRPWQEREVLGKVRTMTAGGLERKYDMDAYIERVVALAAG
jgi:deoxyribodipyrimidine photo-lyase